MPNSHRIFISTLKVNKNTKRADDGGVGGIRKTLTHFSHLYTFKALRKRKGEEGKGKETHVLRSLREENA